MSFRTVGRHARWVGVDSRPSVTEIAARLVDEKATADHHAAYRQAVARQAAVLAAMDAPTDTLPAITSWADPAIGIGHVAIIRDGHFVDPEITQPISRAELLAAIECDGGRPMHELDFAQVTGGAL